MATQATDVRFRFVNPMAELRQVIAQAEGEHP